MKKKTIVLAFLFHRLFNTAAYAALLFLCSELMKCFAGGGGSQGGWSDFQGVAALVALV